MRNWVTVSLLAAFVIGLGTASADVISPNVPGAPGTGAVHYYARDRGQAVGYLGPDGTYTRASASDPWVGITPFSLPSQRLMPGESTWGIFAIRELEAGSTENPNYIQTLLGGSVYYEWTDTNNMTGNTAIVGMYYGGWDSKVTLSNGGTTLSVETVGAHIEVWAVDKSWINLEGSSQGPRFDPNWRTAANQYLGWVDSNATTSVKLLSGTSTSVRFIGTQLNGGANPFAFDGQSHLYFNVDANDSSGLWNSIWGGSNYFTDPTGAHADLDLSFDIDPGSYGWSTNSHDDGGVIVPEPATLGLLALGGLAMLRRRKTRAI